jgi:N-acetyl-anhydromuramyl-L-alanine amidase AmpD
MPGNIASDGLDRRGRVAFGPKTSWLRRQYSVIVRRMAQFSPDSSVVEHVEPSPNFDERTGLARPDMIVLHYTGMQFANEAVQRLCDPDARVSSH